MNTLVTLIQQLHRTQVTYTIDGLSLFDQILLLGSPLIPLRLRPLC